MIEEAIEPEVIREADLCPACGSASMRTLFHGTDRPLRHHFELLRSRGMYRLPADAPVSPADRGRAESLLSRQLLVCAREDAASRAEDFYRRIVLGTMCASSNAPLNRPRRPGRCSMSAAAAAFPAPAARARSQSDGPRLLHGRRSHGMECQPRARDVRNAFTGPAAPGPSRSSRCSMSWNISTIRSATWKKRYKLLASDGRLVIQVPNAASWQFLLFGQNWNGIDIPRHLVNFKEKDLVALVESCGFEVLRATSSFRCATIRRAWRPHPPALDPMSRRVRKVPETPAVRLIKDVIYLGLRVLACRSR